MLLTNLRDVVQMPVTKKEACRRLKCGPERLDRVCLEEFGLTWVQIRDKRIADRNSDLGHIKFSLRRF